MKTETVYDYVDENGALLYQNVRVEEPGKEKTFYYRRPDGNGGWIYDLDGVRRVLYHLPQILAAIARCERIFGCEGEKDVATLEGFGLIATSTKNLIQFAPLFKDAHFALLYDSDAAGRKIRDEVAAALAPVCSDLRIIHLSHANRDDGFDVNDWAAEGHTSEHLLELVTAAEAITTAKAQGGADILNEVATIIRRFVVMSDAQRDTAAAWVLHTYLIPGLRVTVYLFVSSAEKGSGKTTFLELLSILCRSALYAGGGMTKAVLVRCPETYSTILIDEIDKWLNSDKELAAAVCGILNSGYKKTGTYLMMEGDGKSRAMKKFRTFAAKALGGIKLNCLPDTVADRSIIMRLCRASHSDQYQQFFEEEIEPLAESLRERMIAWAAENGQAALAAIKDLWHRWREDPDLADFAKRAPRLFQLWVVLIAVCDVVGGEWPARIRIAAREIALGEPAEDQSIGVALLSDIRRVRDELQQEEPKDRIWSDTLAKRLSTLEEPAADWSTISKGKPITQNWLASSLHEYREYGVRRSDDVRIGEKVRKGYYFSWFEAVWQALCPDEPTASATNATTLYRSDFEPDNKALHNGACSESKNSSNLDGQSDVARVALPLGVVRTSDDERESLDL